MQNQIKREFPAKGFGVWAGRSYGVFRNNIPALAQKDLENVSNTSVVG